MIRSAEGGTNYDLHNTIIGMCNIALPQQEGVITGINSQYTSVHVLKCNDSSFIFRIFLNEMAI